MFTSKSEKSLEKTKQRVIDGFGSYQYKNNFFKFEGNWKNGKTHDINNYKRSRLNFEDNLCSSTQSRYGKLFILDGSYYFGNFTNGEIIGQGLKFNANSGDVYSGKFYMGEMHGFGEMVYHDGSIFRGYWNMNKPQGYGIISFRDKSVYEGNILSGLKHGFGKLVENDGEVFEGHWKNDLRHGHGKTTYKDGTTYSGEYYRGKYHGSGRMLHASGMKYSGMWLIGFPVLYTSQLVFTSSPISQIIPIIENTLLDFNVACMGNEGMIQESNRVVKLNCYLIDKNIKEENDVKNITSDIPKLVRECCVKENEQNLLKMKILNIERKTPTDKEKDVKEGRDGKEKSGNLRKQKKEVSLDDVIETESLKPGIIEQGTTTFPNTFIMATMQQLQKSITNQKIEKSKPINSPLNNIHFAPSGLYIVVASDITEPAFLNERPESATVFVLITKPKKNNKKDKKYVLLTILKILNIN
ncbi:MORN repeat-containing protein 1 [Intoshia linei]|uniref:MORN repeat-containing protein 1 n=1 Tax=Intoshia linei TaxID=1819745 RepID=A0A177B6D8_9BILA|nr:MORN repeat-containing protein 1 [Intoshia linei]